MGVLTALFGGTYAAVGGGSKASAAVKTPPINASSSDEESFIKCASFFRFYAPNRRIDTYIPQCRNFLDQANKDEKAKH